MIAELAHRIRLAARPGLDPGAHPGRVVERHGDLCARRRVIGQIDALSPALSKEADDAVAARDLARNVGRQRLGPRLDDNRFRAQVAAARVTESCALTILIAAG